MLSYSFTSIISLVLPDEGRDGGAEDFHGVQHLVAGKGGERHLEIQAGGKRDRSIFSGHWR